MPRLKMSKSEWKKLQRIALDHPFYDVHQPPISEEEARAIVERENKLTGKEFVDAIYAKLGMERPERTSK